MSMIFRWQSKKTLRATLESWEEIREAENVKEVEEARRMGFDDARRMFEKERKQMWQFASLAALGNAKNSPKLLDIATKAFNASLEEDEDERI